MKKLLVLTLIVSMLTFTGVAFADDTTGHNDGSGHVVTSSDKPATAPTAAQFETAAKTISDASKVAAMAGATAKLDDGYTRHTLSDDAILGAATSTFTSLTSGLPTGSQAYPFARVSTTGLTEGHVYQINLPTGFSLAGVTAVKFYPKPATAPTVTSPYMWFVASSDTALTKITESSTADQIKTAAASAKGYWLEFVFASNDYGVKVAALPAAIEAAATGSAKSENVVGGSGGGCVAGTSAAALALAVLGFVTAKRRA